MRNKEAEIKRLCEKNNVELLLLFGSRAAHTCREESDIDLGILFNNAALINKAEIIAQLTAVFKEHPVDAVILNHADPLLKFAIISNYQILYCKDTEVFINFYLNALKQYNDIQKFLKLEDLYLENFLGGARDGTQRCNPPQVN
ncbi:MAG: nucleotidyltransferase domain-containing protein [Firmicutes bacterium]|nr:nucleotidyltransferase domain-containing protein [Bacillota bacterium]